MLSSTPYSDHVAARLLDFFRVGTPWQRRLWVIGLVLGIKELLEAATAVPERVLSWGAVSALTVELERLTGRDAAIGDSPLQQSLQGTLGRVRQEKELDPRGHDAEVLRQLLATVEPGYLSRLANLLSNSNKRPKPERAARSIASHLLDSGFSPMFLHQWFSHRIRYDQTPRTLPELVEEANGLFANADRTFEVMVAFESVPTTASSPIGVPNWRNSGDVSLWLARNGFKRRDIRQRGGLLLQVKAKDPWSAAELASELVEQSVARFTVGSPGRINPVPFVWIRGEQHPYPLGRPRRGVEVHALQREDRLFASATADKIDAAIELLGPFENGPPAPAVSGAWSALETLLVGPGDTDKVVAADRLAALVACSYARAELTSLSFAHSPATPDLLAAALSTAATGRERAGLVLAEFEAGRSLSLSDASDLAGQTRTKDLLTNPRDRLDDIRGHAAASLRRLYRQRNLVVHGGRLSAVALRASLRAAAPIVGAGLDRLAHSWFTTRTQPISLSAKAQVSLELAGSAQRTGLADLLE